MSVEFDIDADEWGKIRLMADGTYGTMNPDKVVIHWGGAGEAAHGLDEEIARLKSWDRYHTYTKRWAGGIAYNYGIGDTGTIFRCRGINQSGATSGDFEDDGVPENKEALAAVWIGGQKDKPSEAALGAYERFIRSTNLPLVIGHMEIKSTACPGPELMAFVAAESWKTNKPSPIFQENWDWGLAERILTKHSVPKTLLDYEHFITLLQRYDKGHLHA